MEIEKEFLNAYDRYANKILKHLYFRTNNKELAEDLMQQTFLKAWKYIASGGKEIKNLHALLYKTANNLIIDHYRQKGKQAFPLDEIDEKELSAPAEQVEEANNQIDKQKIEIMLEVLPDKNKQLIIYRYIDSMSLKEIKEITGLSMNNIAVNIYRSLKKIKNNFDSQNPYV
jgi:RNA polymerase sigma-70 factor (ECF subfamily)